MAFEYRWSSSSSDLWAAMTQTSALADNSPGDTATGEHVETVTTGTSAPYCGLVEASAQLVAQVYLTTSHALTALSFSYSLTAWQTIGDACLENPGDPGLAQTPGTAQALVQALGPGGWETIQTVSLVAPDLTDADPDTTGGTEEVVLDVAACNVRVVLSHAQNMVTSNGIVAAEIDLTDLRIVGVNSGQACTEGENGGAGGGEGNGPGDQGHACTCSWTSASAPGGQWGAATVPSGIWNPREC